MSVYWGPVGTLLPPSNVFYCSQERIITQKFLVWPWINLVTFCMQYYAIKYEQTKEQDEDTTPFECGVETMIYEPLWSVFRCKEVLVPIHHTTSMHYTLLVIDNEKRRFSHMNSLRPPIDEFTNEEKYHRNAAKVVCSNSTNAVLCFPYCCMLLSN